MVLIRRIAICLFYLFSAACIFPQELNYAVSVIKKILAESPEGKILNTNIQSMEISIEHQKKTWLPSVQFDFTADSKMLHGDYNYIRNGGILSGSQLIINPSTSIGVSQNLPGNGRLSMNVGYGISYLTGQNAFMQEPYLQISLSQQLSYGAFGLTKDPTIQQFNNQVLLSRLENKKAIFDFAVNFISTVQNYDLALHEYEYYEMMVTKTNAEYLEQSKRHQSGQYSNLELFNAHMQLTQAKQNLEQSKHRLTEAKTRLVVYDCSDLLENTEQFRNDILSLFNIENDTINPRTVQEYELIFEIEDEKLSKKIDKSKLAPSLYLQASVIPDQNQYNLYSDFSRSLRELTTNPYPWTLNASIGFHIDLDLTSQDKTINALYDNKIQNLNTQLGIIIEEQNRLRYLYKDWSESFSKYCTDLETAMSDEEEFRRDMKTLFERNLITEAQYWGTELSYHEIRLNYYRSIWNMIQGKIQILSLTSDWMNFLNHFLEVEK
ncbi:MAG: hypothetical protein J6Y69_04085 [Treponema sp.]|nr:hypothetical protein [Treponema sp.]